MGWRDPFPFLITVCCCEGDIWFLSDDVMAPLIFHYAQRILDIVAMLTLHPSLGWITICRLRCTRFFQGGCGQQWQVEVVYVIKLNFHFELLNPLFSSIILWLAIGPIHFYRGVNEPLLKGNGCTLSCNFKSLLNHFSNFIFLSQGIWIKEDQNASVKAFINSAVIPSPIALESSFTIWTSRHPQRASFAISTKRWRTMISPVAAKRPDSKMTPRSAILQISFGRVRPWLAVANQNGHLKAVYTPSFGTRQRGVSVGKTNSKSTLKELVSPLHRCFVNSVSQGDVFLNAFSICII